MFMSLWVVLSLSCLYSAPWASSVSSISFFFLIDQWTLWEVFSQSFCIPKSNGKLQGFSRVNRDLVISVWCFDYVIGFLCKKWCLMIPLNEVRTIEMQESKVYWEVKWFLSLARRGLKGELPSSILDGMVF